MGTAMPITDPRRERIRSVQEIVQPRRRTARGHAVAVAAALLICLSPATGSAQQATMVQKAERYAYMSGLIAMAGLKCGVNRDRIGKFVRMRGYVIGRIIRAMRARGDNSFSQDRAKVHFDRGRTVGRGRQFDCSKARPGFERAYQKVSTVAGPHVN